MKKYFAECIGTMVLTLLGCGTAVFVGCGEPAGVFATAAAFGLSVIAMAYTIGAISGCHINPAITLGVALSGRMSWKDACGYWVGQFIGGIIGAAVLSRDEAWGETHKILTITSRGRQRRRQCRRRVRCSPCRGHRHIHLCPCRSRHHRCQEGSRQSRRPRHRSDACAHPPCVHQPHRHFGQPRPFIRTRPLRRWRSPQGCLGVHCCSSRGRCSCRARVEMCRRLL